MAQNEKSGQEPSRSGSDSQDSDTIEIGKDAGPQELTTPRAQFSGALKPFAYLDLAISYLEVVILAGGVLLMATNSVANVIGRFVFGQSLFFSQEANQFLIILITAAGIGYAARHGRHIRMSAFYDSLGDRPRKLLMIVISLLTAGAMFILAYYSFTYAFSVYETGRVAASTRIPMWVPLIWLPIGFTITGIQYVLTALANIARRDVYISASVVDTYEDSETPV